jgi:putative oxidoreductase
MVNQRWFRLAVRLLLGAAFVYAGAVKISDPQEFADNIASFQLLPNGFVSPFALGLPLFEILTGSLLMIGWMNGPAALGILTISGVFVIAVASALARGLTIDCGCFGSAIPTRTRMWFDFGRDLVLLSAALFAYASVRLPFLHASGESKRTEM